MFTIGKVAAQAQVSPDSIRFYERQGLIRPASKTVSGYRLYTDEAVRRIAFIKHAQQCGFSLAEVRELLELRGNDRACCEDIYRVAAEKKRELDAKIETLRAMSRALARLTEICSRDQASLEDCPILGALEEGLAKRRAEQRPQARRRTT
jgi:MerR family Zn(II)-responsive transcriptional regulator of zntA